MAMPIIFRLVLGCFYSRVTGAFLPLFDQGDAGWFHAEARQLDLTDLWCR
jgi:hypothetical protein